VEVLDLEEKVILVRILKKEDVMLRTEVPFAHYTIHWGAVVNIVMNVRIS
jgi:hypothetical protein